MEEHIEASKNIDMSSGVNNTTINYDALID